MKGIMLLGLGLFLLAGQAQAAVVGEAVTYEAEGVKLQGYIAYDDALTGKRPGVMVVHEWWGHNEYARMRARMLAELGYTALAVDMYGQGKQAAHPKEAGEFSAAVRNNLPVARARFSAAMELLKKHPTVDPGKIGAIGYCFGGGLVLQMARDGLELKGVVSFHGSLAPADPARKGEVKARVMICNGGDDSFVTLEQIRDFVAEMASAGASFRYISYPGALHSFTNPEADGLGKKFDLSVAYHPDADRESWQDMVYFFQRTFE
jgi:dienelactone hydrolase